MSDGPFETDAQVRMAAFEFLATLRDRHGEVLPWKPLASGFTFRGERVPILGPQGIFRPRVLPDMPLSIATAPARTGRPRTYDDALTPDGLLLYRYRGNDPFHRDNVGLRTAMQRRVPLVYAHGVEKGWYFTTWPAYVSGDDPRALTFTVALDDASSMAGPTTMLGDSDPVARRAYVTVTAKRRLHQEEFRCRVLRAYQQRCALCRLRHRELLEAAHILPDSDPRGEPVVSNGLALCALHHAAFDQLLIGIRPDLVVQVRPDILRESDGPMLVHGLQDFHDQRILQPHRAADRANPDHLAERFEQFRRAV